MFGNKDKIEKLAKGDNHCKVVFKIPMLVLGPNNIYVQSFEGRLEECCDGYILSGKDGFVCFGLQDVSSVQ